MNTTLFDETVQVLIEKRNALIEEHKDIRKRIEDNNAAFTILLEQRKVTTDEHDLEHLRLIAFILESSTRDFNLNLCQASQAINCLTNAINALANREIVTDDWR